jgi:thymidine kinase
MSDGQIQLIIGGMFAGKSTELLRRMKRFQVAKKKCLYIKYLHDTRFSKDCIATHNNEQIAAVPCDNLTDLEKFLDSYDCFGVDEGQFFPDIISFCEKAANMGKIVVVAALDGTFQRKAFGSICELIPMCEDVTKLKAICMLCQKEASFSKRITTSVDTVDIGGSDKYVAVCRTCFHK